MKRKCTPEDRSPGSGLAIDERDEETTLEPLLVNGFLSLAPTTRRHVLSKREMVPHPTINFILTELSAGRTITEINVFENSSSRYRRGESVTALREIHRRYNKYTKLILQDGLWVLAPIPRASP